MASKSIQQMACSLEAVTHPDLMRYQIRECGGFRISCSTNFAWESVTSRTTSDDTFNDSW